MGTCCAEASDTCKNKPKLPLLEPHVTFHIAGAHPSVQISLLGLIDSLVDATFTFSETLLIIVSGGSKGISVVMRTILSRDP